MAPFAKSRCYCQAAEEPRSTSGRESSGCADVLGRERQEGQMAGALERFRQHSLVAGAGSRLPAGLDLAAVGDVTAQPGRFLVVHGLGFVDAKGADTPAAEAATAAPWALAIGPGAGRRPRRFLGRLRWLFVRIAQVFLSRFRPASRSLLVSTGRTAGHRAPRRRYHCTRAEQHRGRGPGALPAERPPR